MKRDILKKLREGVKLKPEEIDVISKEFTREKRYGLVWEDHPEGVDLELKGGVFKIEEMKDKKISMNPNSRENLLLEGDNLHSLMALKDAGVKVDVIYIDPPYNTLNETGFRYNDKRIDSNDNYRHSKWLSFMYKRLELARDLMKDDGVIFVSIDDNEQANLKLLMDQVFGEENFLNNIVVKTSSSVNGPKAAHATVSIVKTKEYLLCYSKNISNIKNLQPLYTRKKYMLDSHYRTFLDSNLNKISLMEVLREDKKIIQALNGESLNFNNLNYLFAKNRSYFDYFIDKYSKNVYTDSVYSGKVHEEYEIDLKRGKVVKIGKNLVYRTRNGKGKDRVLTPLSNSIKITDDYTQNRYDAAILGDCWNFSEDMSNLDKEGDVSFKSGKKPLRLIKNIIKLINSGSNATILDFFAGSGTTGQAVMELNKEDGGNRRFILCTNNENNICEEVTYERNRRVITGEYAEEKVEPLPNNLSYYKVDIKNIDDLNIYEKKELDNYRNIVQILWKNDYKIVNEEKEFIEVSNLDENSIIIKLDVIDKSFRNGIDLNKFDKIYAKKYLSREKTFKGIDESKLIFY